MNDSPPQDKDYLVATLFGRVMRLVQSQAKLKLVAENIGWLTLERLATLAINFAVSVWLVRYLGPEDYGLFSYALSFVALFGSVAALGLDNIVIRELSKKPQNPALILSTSFWLTSTASAVTYIVLILCSYKANNAFTQTIIAIIALSLLSRPSHVVDHWFQSQVRSKYAVLVRTATNIATSIAKIVLILLSMPLVAFAVLTAINGFMTGIGLFAAYRKYGNNSFLRETPSLHLGKALLRDSWPLIISGLSVALYMKIDRVMLGQMLGNYELGIYSTAAMLSELWYFLPMLFASTVFPLIVQSYTRADKTHFESQMQVFYDVMALVSYAIAIPVTILAQPMVLLLFGPEYAEAASILQLHIWAFLFVSLGVARGRYLIINNMTRFSMITTVIGGLVNVVMNLWLIPISGGIGAAWATLISYAVAAYISNFLVKRLWSTNAQMTRALLAPFRVHSILRGLNRVA